jgi:sec-independent protein translocase protein TatA
MCLCPVFAFLLDDPLMMLLLGAIAVMLFGERLPEVARSIGKQFMEVKNGVRGLQDEITNAINSATTVDPPKRSTTYYGEPEEREEATAPKFEPPAG